MPSRKFGRRPSRLDEIFQQYAPPVYFVTFCTHRRRPILASNRTHSAFIDFARSAVDFNIAVGRYVIMPDHVHLFVCGHIEFELGRWIGALKQSITRANDWSKSGGQIWREGFFDHVLRSDESMSGKWNYVVQNPVRAGLVKNPEEWPYHGEVVIIDRV